MAEILGDPEELMAIIHRKAQQEAINLQAEAQQRIARQHAEAVAEGEKIRANRLAAAEAAIAEERHRQLAQAALENQHRVLRAQQALLDEVWQQAEVALHTLTGQPEYSAILRRLALAAAQLLRTDTITLAADPRGHALLTAERLATWSKEAGVTFVRAAQPLADWGGLIAQPADGRRQIDATFGTRLALARNELSEAVARTLEIL